MHADQIALVRDFLLRRSRVMKCVFSSPLFLASPARSRNPRSTRCASKGFVQCGVNTGLAGFSQPDSKGVWRGIDVDVCRAVAAAVFGDAAKVRYTPLTAQQRFTALQSGEVDILSRNTTWTLIARHQPRPQLRRRELLRRPGLHGAEEAEREEREAAERRHGLRAARHHHRAQPRRLLPRQQA